MRSYKPPKSALELKRRNAFLRFANQIRCNEPFTKRQHDSHSHHTENPENAQRQIRNMFFRQTLTGVKPSRFRQQTLEADSKGSAVKLVRKSSSRFSETRKR
jgi:hypothetical protein